MSLENLRDALSDVDRQIIDLIAERQRIVTEIGQSKLAEGTATRDFAREKDVIDLGRAQAEAAGIDPELAETILTELIRSSLASQERDRVIAEGLYLKMWSTDEAGGRLVQVPLLVSPRIRRADGEENR